MFGSGNHRSNQFSIQTMTAAVGDKATDEIAARQSKIPDHIDYFVSYTFVGVTKLIANQSTVAKDQEIFGCGSLPESLGLDGDSLGFEQKRATGSQVHVKMSRRKRYLQRLATDGVPAAVVKLIMQDRFARAARPSFDSAIGVAHANRTSNNMAMTNRILLDHACRTQCLDERLAGAITAWHFCLINPQFAVIDLQPCQRGHDVFDHFHARLSVLQNRAARNLDSVLDRSRNPWTVFQIGANKYDAGVGFGGTKLDPPITPAPITHSFNYNRGSYRSLVSYSVHSELPIIRER